MSDNKHHLTPLQRHVMFENGTEQPFDNGYWDNKQQGIYVDAINGEPLFSSQDKFDSGSGWPSFTQPIGSQVINEKPDNSHGMTRIEVRSQASDIHLGHVFNDGPPEQGGLRYCINSAALKFIPQQNLEQLGYTKYLNMFANSTAVNEQRAILAGGCFWGMEDLFAKLSGVIDVVSGYTGGNIANPTYDIVKLGTSNHAESVAVTFDANKVSYADLLKFFFKIHNPTTLNRQGNDIGTQYRSAIFYLDTQQQDIANNVIEKANKSGVFHGKLVTALENFNIFYEAEEYHQNYLTKYPNGYTCHAIREEWSF